MDRLNPNLILIALGVSAVAVLIANRKAAAALGGAAVDAVDGVLSGVVVGIGERVGIPATSETECERAMREGRTWDASFACPAATFIKYLAS